MKNWLEMKPHEFGAGVHRRPTISPADIKALHAHAKRERKLRERREMVQS